jgi:hypothetical protein
MILRPRLTGAIVTLAVVIILYSGCTETDGQSAAAPHSQSETVPPSATLQKTAVQSPFQPLGPRRGSLRKGNAYSITMAEEALPAHQLPKMTSGHPRLLLRPTAWSGGLSVDQLRARAKMEPWLTQVARDMTKPPDHPSAASAITHRALLYLITGDESLVPRIVERIMEAKPQYNVGGGLLQTVLWYDWIYNSKSVSDEQRKKMADKIAEVALKCAEIYESGHAFDIWTHRGSPGWASDVLVAGLVLDDDQPQARKLRSWGMGYFKRNYFRAWQHNGGAWMHGGSSYNIGMIMPDVIAYWASAVAGEDIYAVIERDYGNWLEGHLYYMMSEVLPDKTRSDMVAWDYAPTKLRIKGRRSYWSIARAYQNQEFYAFQRWLGEDPKSGHYGKLLRILFYDEETDAKEPRLKLDSPFVKLWGRDGPGYLQMRSKGWVEDSTVIEFKSGDFVWTHRLANDNNSFWIYHKGRLAVQGGNYGLDKVFGGGGTGSHYFTQSISSNTMLVFQPDEFSYSGGSKAGDLEEPGVIANYGGQRFKYHSGQTCFTFDEYLRRKTEESDTESGLYETGDITAFESAPDNRYAYVSGDATMAYNNPKATYRYRNPRTGQSRENKPKIDLFTRSMVYLMETDNLLIFDRVQSLDPTWRKAWLTHFQGKPEVQDGKLLQAEVPGHIEEFSGGTVKMTWGEGVLKLPDPNDPGRLFIKTFLPKKHTIRRIGGDGYQAWVNGKNRTGDGHKIIDKIDAGRWRIEVSPTEPRKFDNFLHLLHITDTKTEKMPPAAMIETENREMVGVSVGGWLVMFGRKGEIDGEIFYQAPKGKTENLVVDLKRGKKYLVTGIASGVTQMKASPEGSLRFTTTAAGTIRLTPQE